MVLEGDDSGFDTQFSGIIERFLNYGAVTGVDAVEKAQSDCRFVDKAFFYLAGGFEKGFHFTLSFGFRLRQDIFYPASVGKTGIRWRK
jgi:hypothetical protein